MPIRLLLEHDHSFGPKDIPKLILAFEAVLKELNLNNREEPATMLVAKAIVLAAKDGDLDPKRLQEAALKSLSPRT
jgi:hypothetical protein